MGISGLNSPCTKTVFASFLKNCSPQQRGIHDASSGLCTVHLGITFHIEQVCDRQHELQHIINGLGVKFSDSWWTISVRNEFTISCRWDVICGGLAIAVMRCSSIKSFFRPAWYISSGLLGAVMSCCLPQLSIVRHSRVE